MSERTRPRWPGLVLSMVGVAATVGLALVGMLELYIHPRYVVFTVVMSLLAAVLTVSALARTSSPHEHHPITSGSSRSGRVAILALVGLSALVLLVSPPSALSVDLAKQRQVNQTYQPSTSSANLDPGADFATFRVRDWVASIQLAANPEVLGGRPFDEVGFIVPDDDRTDLFFVSRFVVTCCAVDAQPIGVPVVRPAWRKDFREGAWVRVVGSIGVDPRDPGRVAVITTNVDAVPEPDDPYEY